MTTYVALGSSFAAGPGIAPIVQAGAGRSERNYPHQLAARLHLELTDVTCSGATTANILTRAHRLGGRTMPPQIQAVTPGTDVVTLTVGGNDLGYIPTLIKASTMNSLADRLAFLPRPLVERLRRAPYSETSADQVEAVTASLVAVVDAVRERSAGARVVLVDYLTLIGPLSRPGRQLPLTAETIVRVMQIADGLAGAYEQAARRSGAELVRASEASVGHAVGSAEPWVTGYRPDDPGEPGGAPYHPTPAGMTAVADLVVDRLG